MSAPCGWTVEKCGCPAGEDDPWEGFSEEVRERAAALAIHHMWAATGRRFGLCEVTVLPCNPQPREPLYQTFPVEYDVWGDGAGGSFTPVLDAGQWRNLTCGAGCTCRARCEVPLDGPVHSVVEVLVSGQAVPADAYQVHNGYLLVRVDGACWPSCQKYGEEVPGFQVTYLRGEEVPAAVQAAVETLACEYARACVGGECALPERLRRLVRQGVEVEVLPPDDGWLTGIELVDRVIQTTNPGRLHSRPMVLSPDLPPPRVVTWAGGS